MRSKENAIVLPPAFWNRSSSPFVAGARAQPEPPLTDPEVTRNVVEALAAQRLLHTLDDLTPPPVRVDVTGGIVTLRGNTTSRTKAESMARAARCAPGVREVRSRLIADEEIDGAVTRAIDGYPLLRAASIQVDVVEGVVLLSGVAPSPLVANAAVEAAATIPGVRTVATRLNAVGEGRFARAATVALPCIGSTVATTRAPLGHLKLVVMDPRTRRVTYLVVDGGACLDDGPSIDPSPEGWLVLVPVEAIRSLTGHFVRLGLTPSALHLLPSFDERAYTTPPDEWQPPVDYRRQDVRFAV
jgi:osmotically-inducible protein OsmY